MGDEALNRHTGALLLNNHDICWRYGISNSRASLNVSMTTSLYNDRAVNKKSCHAGLCAHQQRGAGGECCDSRQPWLQ